MIKFSQHIHTWDLTPKQAIELQKQLTSHVSLEDEFDKINFVAGIDVGFENKGAITRAAIVILHYPSLELAEYVIARRNTTFPYVPGLLSFREIPAILDAMVQLKQEPDMVFCDGQGYAHPRRLGIACHLGILLDIPSIGVGKSRLIGTHKPPVDQRGAWQPLNDSGEVIGAVLTTRQGVKPVYVSPGHRICLESAVRYVMECTTRFKLPETTRRAHYYASVYGR